MRVRKRIVMVSCFLALLLAQFGLFSLSSISWANGEHYDLLIIAHENFISSLRPLAEWKTHTGIPAYLVSWQAYDRSYPDKWDAPERIKHGIRLCHENLGVKYVLLVGDSDMFPVRYTMIDRLANDTAVGAPRTGYGAYLACDLYYADLYKQDGSFDDWDYDDDHLYGELYGEYFTNSHINVDRIDMIPDVAVGRLPAATSAEVENYVLKLIEYEMNTRGELRTGTTQEWFKNALFIVPNSPGDTLDSIFAGAKTYIGNNYLTSARGFRVTRLIDPGITGVTNGTPTEGLIKYWLNTGVGFVNYGGHGNRDVWDDVFYTWSIDSPGLHNLKLPIVFSTGCGTAKFAVEPPYEGYVDVNGLDHSGINNGERWPTPPTLPQPASLQEDIHDSFPEYMLLKYEGKGAIGYVGCVTGAQAWAKYLDELFYQGWNETVKLGDMWNNAVTQYCSIDKTIDSATLGPIGRGETALMASGDWFKVAGYHQPMKFMLFGDPSLRVGGLENRPPYAENESLEDLTIDEGTTYVFDAADYGFTDYEGTGLSYRWDFNGDGTWDSDWSSATTVSRTFSDNTRCTVKVQASDGTYQSGICDRRLTVVNVSPRPEAYTHLPLGTGPVPCYRIEERKQADFSLIVEDPGSDTFTYSWDFGEGATPRTSSERNPEATFEGPNASAFQWESTIRTYNVTVTVRDDDGGVGTCRVTMEVVHLGLLDRMGGILGLTGVTIAAIAIAGAALWRFRLPRRRREEHRPL